MDSTLYRFTTRWRLPGSREVVYGLLQDISRVSALWPSLYRRVEVVYGGDTSGIGKTVNVETRGILPYSIRWHFRVTQASEPFGFSIEAWGDLCGIGTWAFAPVGDSATDVTYVWDVRADKPLIRRLSFLLRPLFAANHNWVMRQGERALRKELLRTKGRQA